MKFPSNIYSLPPRESLQQPDIGQPSAYRDSVPITHVSRIESIFGAASNIATPVDPAEPLMTLEVWDGYGAGQKRFTESCAPPVMASNDTQAVIKALDNLAAYVLDGSNTP